MHEIKKMNPDDVYTNFDPIYGDEFVEDNTGIDESPYLVPEHKRLLHSRDPEDQEKYHMVHDEESSRAYENYAEKRLKYFKAKHEAYVQSILSQLSITTEEIENHTFYYK